MHAEHLQHSATLDASTCEEIFTSFGLGYGVDASDVNSLQNRHGRLRTVLSDLINMEERAENQRDMYEQEISSIESHKESVNLSVADVIGKVLTLSAEAEYSRKRTEE